MFYLGCVFLLSVTKQEPGSCQEESIRGLPDAQGYSSLGFPLLSDPVVCPSNMQIQQDTEEEPVLYSKDIELTRYVCILRNFSMEGLLERLKCLYVSFLCAYVVELYYRTKLRCHE